MQKVYNPWLTPLPAVKNLILNAQQLKPRVVIVGDIHGCLEEFKALLDKVNFREDDTSLILVGDLVNKGPFSAQVVKYAREINCHCVRGNHDEAMLSHALNVNPNPRPESYSYIDSLSRLGFPYLTAVTITVIVTCFQLLSFREGLYDLKSSSSSSVLACE